MRIAIANTARVWGGAEKILVQLVNGLIARGHHVLVFVRDGSPLVDALPPECERVPLEGGLDLNPVGVARTALVLKRWRADLLVIWTVKDTRIAAVGGRVAGVPLLIRRAYEADMPRKLRHRALNRWLGACYVTNAAATKASLLRSVDTLHDRDVAVIYNGIELATIDAISPVSLDLPGNPLIVAFLARLDPVKGVAELMRAWPHVARAIPNAHLVMAGTGYLDTEVAAWAAHTDTVTLLGFRKDAVGILKTADVLVLPSHREGTPNIIMEAMACGTCIVATAVSGTPELVTNDVSARLIQPRDSDALAHALIEVMSDAELRGKLGGAARERIRAFEFDVMVDRYVSLFAAIAG